MIIRRNDQHLVIRIEKGQERVSLAAVFAFLIVVCLPFHTLTIGGVGLLMLLGIPLLLLSIPAFLNCIKRTVWDTAMIILVAFFAYNILTVLWTPSFSGKSLYNYIKIVVIVMCLYCQEYSYREKKLLLTGAVINCLIVCGLMLTGKYIGYTDNRMTLTVFGVEQDPNYLGYLFLVPMAVFVQRVLLSKAMYQKVLFALLAVLLLFCVLMTGSRGAFLGLVAVVATSVITKFRKLSSRILFCVVMAVCAVVVYGFVVSLLPEAIAKRFSVQLVLDTGGTGRVDIWLDTLSVMKKAPYRLLMGFGTSSSWHLVGNATHNFILQLLLEVGIIGTYLFLKFFWIWCKRLSKKDAMCLSILVGCMTMAMTLSVNTIYYFWLTFILGVVCAKQNDIGTKGD